MFCSLLSLTVVKTEHHHLYTSSEASSHLLSRQTFGHNSVSLTECHTVMKVLQVLTTFELSQECQELKAISDDKQLSYSCFSPHEMLRNHSFPALKYTSNCQQLH